MSTPKKVKYAPAVAEDEALVNAVTTKLRKVMFGMCGAVIDVEMVVDSDSRSLLKNPFSFENVPLAVNTAATGNSVARPIYVPTDGVQITSCLNQAGAQTIFVFPHVLQTAAPPIPFQIIRQFPGQCVATWPGAYHMVINLGSNTAEAINYRLPELTERYCGKPSRCNCPLRENIDNLRSKYKFRQPGRDEPEPLPHPSDAQSGLSGNAAAAGDHDGGEVWSSRGSRGGLRDELRNQSAISDTTTNEQAKEYVGFCKKGEIVKYQCTSSNEWCFKNYSSHSNARTHSLRKHLEENESTEDPDMDRTALEDVSDKKATRKNVLVTDAIKSEISPKNA
ncbi:hypothetical protein DAPPUDRAFT_263284 [Daphnia pulex]|uniref:JmjC domain-containing protein n=1 Tax=Daphnia pulex TaxID=6669 RepID=E9HPG4_DAPPU|nr:hypothetical protein DAPPUDRAFT_263284 [Daphnia pulex]|eukprot:EFX66346.1 hypothetical protein DAPPUDRAFT_263284 [Daphnia pulex]